MNLPHLFDPLALIHTAGYLGLFLIVCAESGLMIGFFLPGDSLLFAAGFLASQGFLNIWTLIIVFFAAAVLGDNIGYMLGARYGARIIAERRAEQARHFFARYGAWAVLVGRFIPGVRAFTPAVAGTAMMPYPQFLTFDTLGAVIWAVGLTALGYYLGATIPDIDVYLLPILVVIVIASMIPIGVRILREMRAARKADR